MEESYRNEPLLYIDQPKISKPYSNMQQQYTSFQHNDQSEKDETVSTSSFKQLSIEEKINYLVQLPKNLFQMKCKIVTNERAYKGTIVARQDDTVDIMHSGRQKITVPIGEILQISLLSL